MGDHLFFDCLISPQHRVDFKAYLHNAGFIGDTKDSGSDPNYPCIFPNVSSLLLRPPAK